MTNPVSTTTRKAKAVRSKKTSKKTSTKTSTKASTKASTTKTAKTAKTAKTKATKPTKRVVVEKQVSVVDSASSETDSLPKLEATRESIVLWFDKAIYDVDEQVKALRQSKCPGGKFLKSLNKTLKGLKSKSVRVMGKKPKKRTNVNSGFLKQVPISAEMSKFIGCDAGVLKSRVDVTKCICAYIKNHDLQNPTDKREILPDSKLKKLLRCSSNDDPLTYYRVQSKLKHHFN